MSGDPFHTVLLHYLEHQKVKEIREASCSLSACYKVGGTLFRKEEIEAYLAVRAPATYAVLVKILSLLSPGSLLDLGAGPGTTWWAAQKAWGEAPVVTAIEREEHFIQIGKALGTHALWKQADLLSLPSFEPHDWVVLSYSLGELFQKSYPSLLSKSWQAARKGVIIVEPGTPKGSEVVLAARELLISQGGSCLAPCPHGQKCPLNANAWCHFSVRLERSFLHRQAKSAFLPYEDEKYAYVIMTKEKQEHPPSRLISSPIKRKGHVLLHLCSPSGLENVTIGRSQKDLYKEARDAAWGDSINIST